ncbi:O-antigen polymerase [Trichococcus flocculiformis]|uniref:O-antigen polymerase n=1 Tax=Trichococcus flocculiformis TaxID=82803 RepID=UPI003DA63DE7
MIFVLFIILIILTISSYLFSESEFISPAFMLCATYLFCVFIAILNVNAWGDISFVTMLTVLTGVIAFLFGCAMTMNRIVTLKTKNKKNKLNIGIYDDNEINVSYTVLIFTILTMCAVAYFYSRYIFNNALLAGSNGSINGLFSYARSIDGNSENYQRMGRVLTLGIYFSKAIGYLAMFILLKEYIYKPEKKITKSKRMLLILILLIYFVLTVLSTGRTAFMYFIIYTMIVASIFYKIKRGWSKNANKKVLKIILISLVLILVAFRIIDLTLRKSIYGSEWTLWTQVSRYFASQFYALNIWLENPTYSSGFEDTETLYNLYSILNIFGANVHIGSNALEGVTVSGLSTNIYTALRRYIHDFGYVGMIVIQFATGAVFTNWFNKIKKRDYLNDTSVILYASLLYTVAFNVIEERTFINILSLSTATHVILIILFWRIVTKKKRKLYENHSIRYTPLYRYRNDN